MNNLKLYYKAKSAANAIIGDYLYGNIKNKTSDEIDISIDSKTMNEIWFIREEMNMSSFIPSELTIRIALQEIVNE